MDWCPLTLWSRGIPSGWVLDTEPFCANVLQIAPLKLRHAGASAGAFGEWLFSFITVFAGGISLEVVGWKIWIWMTLSCFLAIFFVFFLCPEVSPLLARQVTKRQGTSPSNHDIRRPESLLRRLMHCLQRTESSRASLLGTSCPKIFRDRKMPIRLATLERLETARTCFMGMEVITAVFASMLLSIHPWSQLAAPIP